MKQFEYVVPTRTEAVMKSITCDICKTTYNIDADDSFEVNEFISIHHTCGYGSVFGDGWWLDIDICQHCAKERFGKFIRVQDWIESNKKVAAVMERMKGVKVKHTRGSIGVRNDIQSIQL
jgi:hypothetical protein